MLHLAFSGNSFSCDHLTSHKNDDSFIGIVAAKRGVTSHFKFDRIQQLSHVDKKTPPPPLTFSAANLSRAAVTV